MKDFLSIAKQQRSVLIVDDEMINREILGAILSQKFEVTYADNGQQAYDILTADEADFSLIMLDLMMPVMEGFAFLELKNKDARIRSVPVIVMTSDQDAEVRSIRLGAVDFIKKPFDLPEVILARCERVVELSEDQSIIRSTEKDAVTGLYSKEFFFEYIHQLLAHITVDMDAITMNITRFHLINELKGRQQGDRILQQIAGLIVSDILGGTGIACRSEADTFFIYCEHRDDYESLIAGIQQKIAIRDS